MKAPIISWILILCCVTFAKGCIDAKTEGGSDEQIFRPRSITKADPILQNATVAIHNRKTLVFCSGVAIAPRRVLTSDHCLSTNTAGDYTIYRGQDLRTSHTYVVSEVHRHDRLDLGVLILQNIEGRNYLPAAASIHTENSKIRKHNEVFIAGYGGVYANEKGVTKEYTPRYLRWGVMTFNNFLKTYTGKDTSGNLKTYSAGLQLLGVIGSRANSAALQGDSGGPAFFLTDEELARARKGQNIEPKLVGVISNTFANNKGTSRTRIADIRNGHARDWIWSR